MEYFAIVGIIGSVVTAVATATLALITKGYLDETKRMVIEMQKQARIMQDQSETMKNEFELIKKQTDAISEQTNFMFLDTIPEIIVFEKTHRSNEKVKLSFTVRNQGLKTCEFEIRIKNKNIYKNIEEQATQSGKIEKWRFGIIGQQQESIFTWDCNLKIEQQLYLEVEIIYWLPFSSKTKFVCNGIYTYNLNNNYDDSKLGSFTYEEYSPSVHGKLLSI